MGEAEHPHLAEARRLRRKAHEGDIVQLRKAQLLVLLRQAGGHVRQRHGLVEAAKIQVGDDAQHQIVHLVEAVLREGQVAPPAQIVHDRSVFLHTYLLPSGWGIAVIIAQFFRGDKRYTAQKGAV